MTKHYRLSDVYGISRDLPLNYVARQSIDGLFVESLTRDKHIVVYGSSKQGKTCLRKYNLNDDEYIVVTCSNKWTNLAQLNTANSEGSRLHDRAKHDEDCRGYLQDYGEG